MKNSQSENKILSEDMSTETTDEYIEKDMQLFNSIDDNSPIPPYTRRHKIRMNRIFRERVGGSFLPFPEADNLFEKIRSKIVIKLKINELLDKRKKKKMKKYRHNSGNKSIASQKNIKRGKKK